MNKIISGILIFLLIALCLVVGLYIYQRLWINKKNELRRM